MSIGLAETGLAAVKQVVDVWRTGRADSLIEFTRPSRVEPLVVIDQNIVHYPNLVDVMQTLNSAFAGYYLLAVSLMATVGNVEVRSQLDKLSPNRDLTENAINGVTSAWTLAVENYKERLPRANATPSSKQMLALEAQEEGLVGVDNQAITTARELSNLAVGKLLSVEISDGKNKQSVPIAVRLQPSVVRTEALVHILTGDAKDRTFSDRWHGWRSGRLAFFKDLILCQDLISAHRKNLLQDKDGAYTTMSKRASSNALSTMFTGNMSVATASNMIVLSESSLPELELAMGGKLSNSREREKMLAQTSVMIIAVVDTQFDRVTFYHRSIPQATEVGIRDLKASNKGTGPDVSDILKAFSIGVSPSF